jgi:hypothetical protein
MCRLVYATNLQIRDIDLWTNWRIAAVTMTKIAIPCRDKTNAYLAIARK